MTRYLILDAAVCNAYTIHVFKNTFDWHASLYQNTPDENLEDVAPWLFQTDEENLKMILKEYPHVNFSSYLFVNSESSFNSVYSHFKKFVYRTQEGKVYFFRFYDPRVLNKHIVSLDQGQRHSFFGPVDSFLVSRQETGHSKMYSLSNGQLQIHDISDKELFETASS